MTTTEWILIALAVGLGWYFVAGPGSSGYTTGLAGFSGQKASVPTYTGAPSLASDIGRGVCLGGGVALGSAFGNPMAGAGLGSALSPLCGALAPEIGKGLKAAAKDVAWVGAKGYTALRPVISDVVSGAKPLIKPVTALSSAALTLGYASTAGLGIAGFKAVGSAVGESLHSPIGILTAPVVVPTKVAVAITKNVASTAANVGRKILSLF